jgi:REP element-mobilizing transposase RayT
MHAAGTWRGTDGTGIRPFPEPRDPRPRELFDDKPRRAFWQARFYDCNVWTTKKGIEKLRYMHRNPVKRGRVKSPEQWRWSSYRVYLLGSRPGAG